MLILIVRSQRVFQKNYVGNFNHEGCPSLKNIETRRVTSLEQHSMSLGLGLIGTVWSFLSILEGVDALSNSTHSITHGKKTGSVLGNMSVVEGSLRSNEFNCSSYSNERSGWKYQSRQAFAFIGAVVTMLGFGLLVYPQEPSWLTS